ncbi:hypothetical protein [Infirmifilum sp.]|uniref:hypothetical protein n=1 Tax=Infirmifilum sp. TaxID=2856575 RepID=UPI003D0FD254
MRPLLYRDLNEEEKKALRNLARGLSYFARERAYGYIDRIANAYSVITLRQVLMEALRDLKSEYDRGEDVFMPTGKDVETFSKLAELDLSFAKIVASLAISYSWGKEEEGKKQGKDEEKEEFKEEEKVSE